jgi:hypothetical protein
MVLPRNVPAKPGDAQGRRIAANSRKFGFQAVNWNLETVQNGIFGSPNATLFITKNREFVENLAV